MKCLLMKTTFIFKLYYETVKDERRWKRCNECKEECNSIRYGVMAFDCLNANEIIGNKILFLLRGDSVKKLQLHKWEVKKDTGKYHYLECIKCGDRAVKKVSEERFQPIDYSWTNGKRPKIFCKY